MSNQRYELTPIEKSAFNPTLLYLTRAEYGSDWVSTPHYHPYMEILFITKGAGEFLIEGKTYPLKKGDLVVIEQNITHTEKSDAVGALEYIILGVNNITLKIASNELNSSASPTPPQIFPMIRHFDKMFGYLDSMYNELQAKKQNYDTMINSMLTVFLIYIMRHTALAPAIIDQQNIASRECAFVKSYIDKNFAQDLSLDMLSDKSFISKYHLVHAFTVSLGLSPIQYLIERRLLEAKALLETTTHSITLVAQNVGFSSPAYFSLQFRKHYKMSPLAYRKSHLTRELN